MFREASKGPGVPPRGQPCLHPPRPAPRSLVAPGHAESHPTGYHSVCRRTCPALGPRPSSKQGGHGPSAGPRPRFSPGPKPTSLETVGCLPWAKPISPAFLQGALGLGSPLRGPSPSLGPVPRPPRGVSLSQHPPPHTGHSCPASSVLEPLEEGAEAGAPRAPGQEIWWPLQQGPHPAQGGEAPVRAVRQPPSTPGSAAFPTPSPNTAKPRRERERVCHRESRGEWEPRPREPQRARVRTRRRQRRPQPGTWPSRLQGCVLGPEGRREGGPGRTPHCPGEGPHSRLALC